MDYIYNELSEHFRIDESSYSGLVKIKDVRGKCFDGYPVGSKRFAKDGRVKNWQVSLNNKVYLVHRIIWVLTYGSIDSELVIDHLDGNPLNNCISNLALKTVATNARNTKKRRDNSTGITGVSILNDGKGYMYYVASWQDVNGKQNHKHFSFNKLGEAGAKTAAIEYRRQRLLELNANGAGYTERHGGGL